MLDCHCLYPLDSVRHHTLSQKLASLNIPDEIYNWLVTFLNGHSHVTRYAGRTSSIAYINASVVQGSVIDSLAPLSMTS